MGSQEFTPVRMQTDTAGGYFMNRPEKVVFQPVDYWDMGRILDKTINECKKRNLPGFGLMDNTAGTVSRISSIFDGSVNLVNEVLEQNKKGNNIRALLFLDKSARNAAYIFRLFWKELKDREEIPAEVRLPEIRFVNIGRDGYEKSKSRSARALLKETFNEINVGEKVIVVDEFCDTGISLKGAMGLVRSSYGVETKGFQMFSMCPHWYGCNNTVLGVRDLSLNGNLREVFDDLDAKTAVRLLGYFKKITRGDFIRLVSGSDRNFGLDIIETADLWQIIYDKQLIPNKADLEISGDNIWDYVTSAGGYLSRPLRREELPGFHRKYRKSFNILIEKYMERRDELKRHLSLIYTEELK